MSAARLTPLLALLTTVWAPSAVAADAPPHLSHNPFSRPPSEVIPVARDVREDVVSTPETLPLHATMVGRVNRLANVGGRIMKPGDDYQGYRLVTINEDSATFERGGQRTTVYVKSPDTEDRTDGRSRKPERQR